MESAFKFRLCLAKDLSLYRSSDLSVCYHHPPATPAAPVDTVLKTWVCCVVVHNFAFVFADPDNRDLVVSFGKLNSSTVHYFLSTAKCGRFKGQLLATLKRQPKKVWPLRVSLFNVCRMYSAIITGKIACEWQRSIMFNFFFSFLFFVGYQQFDLEFSNFIYFIFYFFALISTLSFAELFPLLLCRTKCLFIYIYNFFKKTMTITKE